MLICITNQKLCTDDFENRIDKIASGKPYAIMLREKELSETDYQELAIKVKEICERHQVNLIINQDIATAQRLNVGAVQVSIDEMRRHGEMLKKFDRVGVSVHTVEQAREAQALGADYLIAGHIFPTECKKNLPARGLRFLKEVCDGVTIPVFAIGGISEVNYKIALMAGAKGVCIMSEAMTTDHPETLAQRFIF
ncbi:MULTISPECIES: thiamine phosphate synthase [unclassified Acetobacterium]|jgi:thiamine-phosphate pyrophosphorylase|uniref:thiamine phosphate synthase n=1 Tax=unclassified Acetobacterium TaxID=2638182 RepID=UPI000DBEB999|nr:MULTISPECIES: thiamine phosphate synthase [unclassified Acetobacterium]AWW27310.1 thiamine phosphate synthase [Acetobacterium sp. KB-1]MDZ5725442.1 thiamine phosphate synthase [Acetobacterium sp. K1/6]